MEHQRAKHLWSFRSWVWQGRRDQGQQHRDNEHQTTVPLLQRSQRQVLWLLLSWRRRIYLRGKSVPFVRRKGCSDRSVFGRFKFVPLNPNILLKHVLTFCFLIQSFFFYRHWIISKSTRPSHSTYGLRTSAVGMQHPTITTTSSSATTTTL